MLSSHIRVWDSFYMHSSRVCTHFFFPALNSYAHISFMHSFLLFGTHFSLLALISPFWHSFLLFCAHFICVHLVYALNSLSPHLIPLLSRSFNIHSCLSCTHFSFVGTNFIGIHFSFFCTHFSFFCTHFICVHLVYAMNSLLSHLVPPFLHPFHMHSCRFGTHFSFSANISHALISFMHSFLFFCTALSFFALISLFSR